jgi:hypothetical protein
VTVSAPGGSFFLDAFDSNHGAYAAGESGAALGIDGSINALGGLSSVSGSAIIAGRESLYVSTSRLFGADLKTNESIDFSLGGGVFSVARDLWSDADIRAGLTSVVGRDVYQTPGRTGAATLTSVGGNAQTRAFAIAPPCACGTDAELDVAALVARARLDNDNDALGLSAAELSSALAQGKIPSGFDCGRFLLGSVSIPSSMLQSIHGRLALFIDGDLTLSGNFASDLGANAELDILVRGDLVVVGQAQIGAIDRPSALRLYIAGSQPIQSTIVLTYAAQIYAPHAAFRATDGTVTGWGAVFAASFETTALYTLHYDRAIVDLGDACTGVPPPRCDGCQQCPSGLACIDGACAACSSDADCCEPFACTNGRCLPLIYTAPKK